MALEEEAAAEGDAAADEQGAKTPPPGLLHSQSSAPPALDRWFGSSKDLSVWNLWSRESGNESAARAPPAPGAAQGAAPGAAPGPVAGGGADVANGSAEAEAAEVPPDVQALRDGLSPEAREHLEKLYTMGVLRPNDPVARQQRYVKALGGAEGNVKVGFQAKAR